MRAVDSGTLHSERETMIVDVLARIERLFARLPMLIGFTVQDCATLSAQSQCAQLNAELSRTSRFTRGPASRNRTRFAPRSRGRCSSCLKNIPPLKNCCAAIPLPGPFTD